MYVFESSERRLNASIPSIVEPSHCYLPWSRHHPSNPPSPLPRQSRPHPPPGERKCTRSASVIKSHPNYTPFDQLFKKGHVRECAKCIPDPFKAAVVVTRHPLHAMFAEYNRANSRGQHTARVSKRNFNPKYFQGAALRNARAAKRFYNNDFKRVHQLGDRAIFVQFEALISRNITEKRAALRKILKFIISIHSDLFLQQQVFSW